ncbi:MAG: hypothetical protein IJV33_11395 [Bacteroidaceae bacterium]|nr:hypothetical protein [Bacteroidaceae bacterium]
MKKKTLLGILVCLFFSVAQAQIGYQVALLNSATGEPRANETVKAEVTITDSQNGIVCSETQTITSNDFGILSFTVGKADTFKDVAIGKLPMSIAVTVDGVLIGKSQILNVPVAEVANTLKSGFTLDELCGKEWIFEVESSSVEKMIFRKDGTCTFSLSDCEGIMYITEMRYSIMGNTIYAYWVKKVPENNYWGNYVHIFVWINGNLYYPQTSTLW